MQSDAPKAVSFTQQHRTEGGVADAHRVFQHRVEHRPQIAGRTTDDLQYIGSGGLLLERLAQLIEQPRVLDGDDGLVCEILHQRDLLIGKWSDLLAINSNPADQFVVFEHWHPDSRSSAAKPCCGSRNWLGCIVCDLDHLFCPHHRVHAATFEGNEWASMFLEIGKFRWRIDARREMKGSTVESKDVAKFGCT